MKLVMYESVGRESPEGLGPGFFADSLHVGRVRIYLQISGMKLASFGPMKGVETLQAKAEGSVNLGATGKTFRVQRLRGKNFSHTASRCEQREDSLQNGS
jgi:hypothetical protein